jgi:hypothetical protein
MRVLRTTLWAPDLTPDATLVIAEDSLKVPVEEAAEPMPGAFQTHEIFEVADALNELQYTLRANQRMTKDKFEREQNMAMLYYYNLFSQEFSMVEPGGVLTQSIPSPLSVAQIRAVFAQIKIHPRWQEKPVRMIALSEDRKLVYLTPEGDIEDDDG